MLTNNTQGKRVFIKDITFYIVPPGQQTARLAPSLQSLKRGVGTEGAFGTGGADNSKPTATARDSGVAVNELDSPPKSPPFPYQTKTEPGNPTIVPHAILERFHFTFLIRHPRYAVPSYYRCCIPPLVEKTGFKDFMPSEAGYDELRALFDYCKDTGMIGPKICGQEIGGNVDGQPSSSNIEICVLDADDLLDDPESVLRKYCGSIGLDFTNEMLNWDNEDDHKFAREAFEKWNGFHDDAINSRDLKPRVHVSPPFQVLPRQNTILTAVVETCAEDRRADVRGVGGKVRRKCRKDDPEDRGRQCRHVRVLEAIRYQGLMRCI